MNNIMVTRVDELLQTIKTKHEDLFQKAKKEFSSLGVVETINKEAKDEAIDIRDYITNGANSFSIWNKSMSKLLTVGNMEPCEKSMLLLTNLLYTVEGPFSAVVNLTVHNRILKEHHDIWDEYNQEFASSFGKIVELSLYIKLKFLRMHGFDFLSELCPRDLRNAIAHQGVRIDSLGSIFFKKGRREKKLTQKELVEQIVVVNGVSDLALNLMGS